MVFSSQRLPVSWLCVCLALAGAAYCVIQVLPALAPLAGLGAETAPLAVEIPCPGSGCTLFQDFTVYGISLWWAGVAYFVFMAILCLKKVHGFAMFAATAALIADAALIVVMLFTAACVACLGVAAIMGLLFLALRRHVTARVMPAPGPSLVFLAWAGLFIAAASSAATELMEPWDIAHGTPAEATHERRVYFAPSCPACRDAVTVFAGSATFIPVAEKASDYAAIRAMHEEIKKGKTMVEALRASDAAKDEPFSLETVSFRLRLLRNKAEVLKLGFDKLPLIMINGMPQNLRPQNVSGAVSGTVHGPASGPMSGPMSGPASGMGSSALPPELSAMDSCGGNTPEPCDPPVSSGPLTSPGAMTPR